MSEYAAIAMMSTKPPKSWPQVMVKREVDWRVIRRLVLSTVGQLRGRVPVVGTEMVVAVGESVGDDEASMALAVIVAVVVIVETILLDLYIKAVSLGVISSFEGIRHCISYLALFTAIVPPTPPPIAAAKMTSIKVRMRKNVVILRPNIVLSVFETA